MCSIDYIYALLCTFVFICIERHSSQAEKGACLHLYHTLYYVRYAISQLCLSFQLLTKFIAFHNSGCRHTCTHKHIHTQSKFSAIWCIINYKQGRLVGGELISFSLEFDDSSLLSSLLLFNEFRGGIGWGVGMANNREDNPLLQCSGGDCCTVEQHGQGLLWFVQEWGVVKLWWEEQGDVGWA